MAFHKVSRAVSKRMLTFSTSDIRIYKKRRECCYTHTNMNCAVTHIFETLATSVKNSSRSSLSGPSVSSLAPALGVHNHCGLSLQESSGGGLLFLRTRFNIILLAFLPSTTGEVFLNCHLSSENKLPDLSKRSGAVNN